ncbi:MAG: hypothetical protein KF878_04335 [Planctomycetes bacterium]|nr:hypothetical protein [Planctomycetota bacterium]
MPIPEFRPLLFLIYLAVIARWNRIRPKHHLTFIVSGPHLRWKSWIAEAMCRILGLDPETLVFYLGHESGRALLGRKNSKGESTTVLDALKAPIVGFDDINRWQPEVKAQTEPFMFGKVSLPSPNGAFEALPVPILTVNPESGTTWPEKLGYDPPMLRRTVISDVTSLEIPFDILEKGDDFLERLGTLDPAPIPKPRRLDWEPGEEVKARLLEVARDREALGDINVSSLAMLAIAATAIDGLEEPRDAVDAMLFCYLSVTEALGRYRPDWRDVASQWRATGAAPCAAGATIDGPMSASLFDYNARLHALAEACDACRVAPEDAEQVIRLGVDKERLRELARLERALKRARLGVRDVRPLASAAQKVAQTLGLSVEDAGVLGAYLLKEVARQARASQRHEVDALVRAVIRKARRVCLD